MISRRCRIQARPNVTIGANKNKPATSSSHGVLSPPSLTSSTALISVHENVSETRNTSNSDGFQMQESGCVPVKCESNVSAKSKTSIVTETPISISNRVCKSPTPPKSSPLSSFRKSHSSSSLKAPNPQSPLKSPVNVAGSTVFSGNEQSFVQRSRTISFASCCQLSPTKDDNLPKLRKKFTGDEPLDPKTMTMQDLIFWNPKNEKKLHEDIRKKRKDSVNESENMFKKDTESDQKCASKPAFAAPQVKITDDGSLVIDESSLTITTENDSGVWETVEEDRASKKLNSMSFRKRPFCRGNPWSELETDLFYDILRATGPDFGLMHEFFPSRTRLELKAKYNREERVNWSRLNQAMAVPTLLSDALYSHANEIIDRIKEEDVKKKLKLSKKNGGFGETSSDLAAKRQHLQHLGVSYAKENHNENDMHSLSRCGNDDCWVNWNEENADLEAEAEEAIIKLLEEDEEQGSTSFDKKSRKEKAGGKKKMKDALLDQAAEEAALVLKERKFEKRKLELKMICEKALSKLDQDFPKFEILIDENAGSVSIEASTACSRKLPIVRIPLGTVARVLPADRNHPQRVFFECSAREGIEPRHYIVQHQMGPGEPSTGYLHLFGTAAS